MDSRIQSKISQQQDHQELSAQQIPSSPSFSNSQQNNILDQAFIVYSDEQILNNSQYSNSNSVPLSNRHSVVSSHSSYSSLDNLSNHTKNGNILGSLSHHNEESSVQDIHASECSQSGIELMRALEPLLQSKDFSRRRRSPRYPVYTAQKQKSQDCQVPLQAIEQGNKKQPLLQMIQDQKSGISSNLQQSSRIVEENYQQASNLFPKLFINQNVQLQTIQPPKSEQSNLFSRLTRSKKLIQQETQISSKNSNLQNSQKGSMNDNQYVSRMTKQYILNTRKEKRIKKMQLKQAHNTFRAFRHEQKPHKR